MHHTQIWRSIRLKILWAAVDQKHFDLAPPHIPTSLYLVLIVLWQYCKFLCQVSGDTCNLELKFSALEQALGEKCSHIMNSLGFMTNHMPSILWEITLAAHSFFANALSAEDFELANQDQQDPPYHPATIGNASLASLTTVSLSDLLPFLLSKCTQTPATPAQPPGNHNINPGKVAPPCKEHQKPFPLLATQAPQLCKNNPHYHPTLYALWSSLLVDNYK